MTGAICAMTMSTEFTTGVTSGPIAGTCAPTVVIFVRTFGTESTRKHAATAVTFARTVVICTRTGAIYVQIVVTFVTTAETSVGISKGKFRIGLGEEERRQPHLVPPFFVIAMEAQVQFGTASESSPTAAESPLPSYRSRLWSILSVYWMSSR
jgi:hypothetical protein